MAAWLRLWSGWNIFFTYLVIWLIKSDQINSGTSLRNASETNAEQQPDAMMLPPPYFTVGVVFLSSCVRTLFSKLLFHFIFFFFLNDQTYLPSLHVQIRAHTCWCSSLLRLRAIWSCVSSSMSKLTAGGGFFKNTWRRPLAYGVNFWWLFVMHVGEWRAALCHNKSEDRPFINDTIDSH